MKMVLIVVTAGICPESPASVSLTLLHEDPR